MKKKEYSDNDIQCIHYIINSAIIKEEKKNEMTETKKARTDTKRKNSA